MIHSDVYSDRGQVESVAKAGGQIDGFATYQMALLGES